MHCFTQDYANFGSVCRPAGFKFANTKSLKSTTRLKLSNQHFAKETSFNSLDILIQNMLHFI